MPRIPAYFEGYQRAARGLNVTPLEEAGYRASRTAEIIQTGLTRSAEETQRSEQIGAEDLQRGLAALQEKQDRQAMLQATRNAGALTIQTMQRLEDSAATPTYRPLVASDPDSPQINVSSIPAPDTPSPRSTPKAPLNPAMAAQIQAFVNAPLPAAVGQMQLPEVPDYGG